MMEQHQHWMRRVLELAALARGRTTPNPMVGAVIVDPSGRLLAEGYHHRAGEAHGEIDALQKLQGKAPGATLYVNLEPCCHYGRTPPCTKALIASGIQHVVVGTQDPNPKVNGQGIQQLQDAGIKVTVGVLEKMCREFNAPYFTHIQHHRPMISLKMAMSLDARIATYTGDARWLSGPEARRWAHQMRNDADVILVGANTVVLDNPALTVRHVPGRDPIRVVLDSHLRTPEASQMYQPPLATGTWILTTQPHTHPAFSKFQAQGVRVVSMPADAHGHVSIPAVLDYLHREEKIHLLVEGGGIIHQSFLQQRYVDKLHLVVTPWLIGDNGKPAFPFPGPELLAESIRLRDLNMTPLGTDILLEASPDWTEQT